MPLLDWFLAPLSGASTHEIAPWASWHARLMVLGWGLLLPLGALAARFCKVMPSQGWPLRLDNPFWWHAHRVLQWSGVLAMTVGVVLAWRGAQGATELARIHAVAGWALCLAGWAQVAGALLRGSKGGPTDRQLRGDHYDMTRWRLFFERAHKGIGWLAVIAAIGVIALGFVVADAPRWMPLALGAWWLALAGAFAALQRRGRCIDTYQAIWGPDPMHPGNRIPPVGWGVRRPFG
ncbi:cytochrome B [Variovorax sp. Root411]|uniref:cytochrome B n=1 Tax=Variovorax sp. Root411 TaxID=1736530 RepID=UPI000B2394AA|nr:cytochrome B [Variovorax sp. Root411]